MIVKSVFILIAVRDYMGGWVGYQMSQNYNVSLTFRNIV